MTRLCFVKMIPHGHLQSRYYSRYVFIVAKYHKTSFQHLTILFMSSWWGNSKNMQEIEFSRWLFEDRPRQGKNVLPDGLNWLCYLAGSSKSHRENSISCIFLESPHQVDMENVVKCYKHFFCYFNALKTNCGHTIYKNYY